RKHLSDERAREDGQEPRSEHLDHEHREDRRRSKGVARRVQISVPGLRVRMAKLALINRQYKREKLVAKYSKRREALIAIIENSKVSDEVRFAARLKLQQLPRNANPTRLRNRCALTGRPRGVFRKFGLGRNKLREYAMRGEIPGIVKASW